METTIPARIMVNEFNSPLPANAPVNILLVDDEERNLSVLESLLHSPEYQLTRAPSAEHALRHLLEGDFAVIVLDVQMPQMTGIELANLIKQRKRTQHIPIIFLTAYFHDDKDVLEGYSRGAVDYLSKPINPQILKSKIAVFADLFRKTRALAAANLALEQEIGRRQAAEEALRQANNDLERRVEQRAADLIRVNSELREREKELGLARDKALAASRAKDDFFAQLSHELRTPLNPVLLIASDAAVNPSLPPSARADFAMIAENVALEARLIDDLLDLTRISRGALTLQPRPFDFHAVIRDAIEMVQAEISQKQIVLRLLLPAEHYMVLGDDVRVRQVLWNVLKNAVKFTPAAGTIVVELEAFSEGNPITIRIADNGIGMTAEELERAFDAFSQGDHATRGGSHRFGGLGLGLAISRMLVSLHGGSIRAESPGRNKGTTILIELPLRAIPTPITRIPPSAELAPEPPKISPSANSSGRHRILLVEDHQPTAGALAHLLGRRGYDVRVAGSLSEARSLVAREAFDLLISDIGLPDGTGYELMSELRRLSPLIGIALTGYGMDADLARSKEAGFASHLTKPVTTRELDKVLHSVLRTNSVPTDPSWTMGQDIIS